MDREAKTWSKVDEDPNQGCGFMEIRAFFIKTQETHSLETPLTRLSQLGLGKSQNWVSQSQASLTLLLTQLSDLLIS